MARDIYIYIYIICCIMEILAILHYITVYYIIPSPSTILIILSYIIPSKENTLLSAANPGRNVGVD